MKSKITKAIAILQYLHGNHDKGHCDFKAENMLLFGPKLNQIRVCDMESASDFGQLRSIYVSPYICSPELAQHVVAGGGSGLRVSAAEDIWAVGVTVLYLLTGSHPFPANDGVEPLASLTQEDVQKVLKKSGKVKKNSQLESFLLKCLSVDVADRASRVSELQESGWISGGDKTQFGRTSMGKMDKMDSKLDDLKEDVEGVLEGVEGLQIGMSDIKHGVEAVQKTVINLDRSPIPTNFVIELPPDGSDNVQAQMKAGVQTLQRVFSPNSTKRQVQEAVKGKSLTLRLVCQATGAPVGDGYVIQDPDYVPHLLPLMKAGLLAMKGLNLASACGRMFGLPTPTIPRSAMTSVDTMLD